MSNHFASDADEVLGARPRARSPSVPLKATLGELLRAKGALAPTAAATTATTSSPPAPPLAREGLALRPLGERGEHRLSDAERRLLWAEPPRRTLIVLPVSRRGLDADALAALAAHCRALGQRVEGQVLERRRPRTELRPAQALTRLRSTAFRDGVAAIRSSYRADAAPAGPPQTRTQGS